MVSAVIFPGRECTFVANFVDEQDAIEMIDFVLVRNGLYTAHIDAFRLAVSVMEIYAQVVVSRYLAAKVRN